MKIITKNGIKSLLKTNRLFIIVTIFITNVLVLLLSININMVFSLSTQNNENTINDKDTDPYIYIDFYQEVIELGEGINFFNVYNENKIKTYKLNGNTFNTNIEKKNEEYNIKEKWMNDIFYEILNNARNLKLEGQKYYIKTINSKIDKNYQFKIEYEAIQHQMAARVKVYKRNKEIKNLYYDFGGFIYDIDIKKDSDGKIFLVLCTLSYGGSGWSTAANFYQLYL